MNTENIIEQSTIEDVKRGYMITKGTSRAPGRLACMYCNAQFERGIVYPQNSQLMDAERAASAHVQQAHGGPFTALLSLGKKVTGLSDLQTEMLSLLYAGYSDTDIARKSGGKAESTIRNHRFQLRKRTREAMILCTLMDLLDEQNRQRQQRTEEFYQFSTPLTVDDDRVIVTKAEAQKIITKYIQFSDQAVQTKGSEAIGPEELAAGALTLQRWPKKQKEKLVVLDVIARLFKADREYTEQEVNELLAGVYNDYVTLRRYLIDYGLLQRQPGGGAYRLN